MGDPLPIFSTDEHSKSILTGISGVRAAGLTYIPTAIPPRNAVERSVRPEIFDRLQQQAARRAIMEAACMRRAAIARG